MKKLLLLIPLILTSCTVYRQNFDCPPDPGVPCTSVTDLEQMIIETDRGPDIFVGSAQCTPRNARRVWIAEYINERGCRVRGHYLYLTEDRGC